MKQIIQNLKSGETILEEVPAPQVKSGNVLIQTKSSLVSLGTEKMLVEFGKSNLIAKARQQPEKVKMVLDKIKSDGLIPTLEAVFRKLGEPLPLGYCNAGVVIGVGDGVTEFKIGDRVASNGPHAEIVNVPENLVAPIPENVSYNEAAFTVIASIGLQGIRLVQPTLGENIVVVGLGLIGLITAELLKANGCNVIGYDFDESKIELAKSKGIAAYNLSEGIDPVNTTMSQTGGVGADAVIITASTKSNDVISEAAKMSRKKGRIVLVGVIGLEVNRADFFEKELSFQVSCSYGPGRYDDSYERNGIDYPLPFVRWTENRNFRAILNAISNKQLDVSDLITEEIDLKDYNQVYGSLGKNKSIASIITYDDNVDISSKITVNNKKYKNGDGILGIVGAGNFTKMTMMPILKKTEAQIKYLVSSGGVSGTHVAKKYNVGISATSYDEILQDKNLEAVIITTQHDLHKEMVIKALNNEKHVFVEKPLALNSAELAEIIKAYEGQNKSLMVGFNRRFSPFAKKAKKLIGTGEDTNIIATMNAGAIPPGHWVHDMKVGGGRIIGEACHLIDLMSYIVQSKVKEVQATALGNNSEENSDNVAILLKFENGSQGTLNYFSNGHKSYSKERVEVYSQGRTLVIDNFRKMTGYGFKGFSKMTKKQDKGHRSQFEEYVNFVKNGGESLISFEEIINTTKASFAAVESLKTRSLIKIQ